MMVLHVLASALILAAALGLARRAALPYEVRVRTLEEWQRFLRHLMPLIEWKRMALAQAVSEAGRGLPHLQPAMERLGEELRDRDTELHTAWNGMLAGLPGLWGEDQPVLSELGRVLGTSDADHQHNHLEAAGREVGRLLEDARRARSKDGRMLPALVSAVGLMVVILML